MVTIEINGTKYETDEGKTILEVAEDNNIKIPTLCYNKALENYGACRLCTVEVLTDKGSKLATACTSAATDGLRVLTDSERVINSRKMTIELLLSRSPEEEILLNLAKEYGVEKLRFKKKDDDCVLCGLCVRMCERMGVNAISFQNRGIDREIGTPFMESSDVCQTCGACAFICPTSRYTLKKVERVSNKKSIPLLSEFDEKLSTQNPIYIPFPQAIPKIPVIDKEKCAYYLTGNCKTCREFCEAEAIDYDQEDKVEEIDVGAVIVASGFDLFDPKIKQEYGYGRYKNVLNSKEFERYLNASGPTSGHIIKPSDNTTPKKVAFLQCVGSRDERTNEYCSSVCCMYAIKEAIIAQEHVPGLEAHIFFMDIRAFGKEFDDYYIRAEKQHGIKFKRCRVPNIDEDPETEQLIINYVEDEELKKETFDMVVLSCGLESAKSTKELSKKLGINLNEYGFIKTESFTPLESTKPGIFITGAASGPKDIPMTVTDASGAASKASSLISSERHTLETIKEYPPERETHGEVPRIGVFVCRCGINIASVVDVPAVAEYAKSLPYVVYADEFIYSCSQDTQEKITDLIKEHNLNRVIVSACTPRTHEPLFQSTLREAGINAHLFEMANIRDQCSWVHRDDPEKATEKAKDLVRMAVSKARLLEPLKRVQLPVISKGLVIGGGVSGMTAALELADQGFETYLVEREKELGGFLHRTYYTLGKEKPQELLKSLIKKVNDNELIHVYKGAQIKDITGYVGNFKTTITLGNKKEEEIEHGAVIVATGSKEYIPKEYLYGKDKSVITKWQLEEKLAKGNFKAKNVVMIQCVGSRDEERTYCSRVCCSDAIKNALKIKEISPETNIYILYKDIRTYGFREKYYREAAEKGVIFLRYDDETKPIVVSKNGLQVTAHDPILKKDIIFKPDFLVLNNALLPPEGTKNLSQMLKLPITKDGFFLEAHMKLRPVDFATDGVFLCGKAHSPKFIDECIAQAGAAASRASTILSKESLESEAVVSEVNETLCNGCGLCVEVCSFSAIEMKDGKAEVNASLCKGCGLCCSTCRSGAIQQKGFNDHQIIQTIKGSLNEVI
jgi:heterodisulfide reductase subunit A